MIESKTAFSMFLPYFSMNTLSRNLKALCVLDKREHIL